MSKLQLKLDGTRASDNVILGMVCAIEASLTTDQPVAWRDVKLGLARNLITDEGLTSMIRSLGRCPQLVRLTLDLTENQDIRHPEKLDRMLGALGHIPSLHIRLDTLFCYIPLKQTSDEDMLPMPDVRTFSCSLLRHQIFPGALRIPHRLVHLCLDISQSQLMGTMDKELAGFRTLGQALMATAATLQNLTLGMGHMQMTDATFVYFCSVGLSPLIRLRRLSLDTACNQLTDIGVDALQHALLSPTMQHLEWKLCFNVDVRAVHLHAAPCLRVVLLNVCGTRVAHIQLPAQVAHLMVDSHRSMWSSPPPMFISGVDAVQRLTLELNGNTASILRHITEKRGAMKIDLRLDLHKICPAAMDRVLGSIIRFGKADMLQRLQFTQPDRPYIDVTRRLSSVLSVCRDLLSLRLELLSAIGLCEILTSVGHDLVHLVYFHLRVKALRDTIERPTVAPCMLLAQDEHHRVLRVVFLDFPDIDLTDEAVALLVDAAVQRCEKNPRNVNTLKVEGSSVGVCAFAALSVWVTFVFCDFCEKYKCM